MGGGSLMTPMLVFLFGFKPTVAIGTDIVHGAIFKSFGAVRHRQLGTVHARLTLWMLAGSAPFSLVGVALSTWLCAPLRRRLRGRGRDHPRRGADRRRRRIRGQDLRHGPREERPAVRAQSRRQEGRARARHERRLHRRAHVGRQRHVLRARDAARLPADRLEGRRHGHLPRGSAPLGRGRRPSRRRQRRPGGDRIAARRLDPGRAAREQHLREAARPGAPPRPRDDADAGGAEARRDARRRDS